MQTPCTTQHRKEVTMINDLPLSPIHRGTHRWLWLKLTNGSLYSPFKILAAVEPHHDKAKQRTWHCKIEFSSQVLSDMRLGTFLVSIHPCSFTRKSDYTLSRLSKLHMCKLWTIRITKYGFQANSHFKGESEFVQDFLRIIQTERHFSQTKILLGYTHNLNIDGKCKCCMHNLW